MKIIVSRNNIKNFSGALSLISSKSTQDSITNHLKIETEENSETGEKFMILSATNYETNLIVKIPADFDGVGKICVNSAKFLNLIREFYQTDLQIEIDDTRQWLNMKCGDMETKLPGVEISMFPSMEMEKPVDRFRMGGDDLGKALKKAIDCIPENSNLNYLKGLSVRHLGDSRMEFAGSDSMRIGRTIRKASELTAEEVSLIVPRKSAQEIIGIIEREQGDCDVYFDKSVIQIHTANLSYQTRLLKDHYPDISRIFERKGNSVMRVNREKLLTFLKVLKVISENNAQYSMKMIFDRNEVELVGEKKESEAQVKIKCEFEGDVDYIAFNVSILHWGVQSFEESKEENLIFYLSSPEQACVLEADDLRHYSFLCMPMKISW